MRRLLALLLAFSQPAAAAGCYTELDLQAEAIVRTAIAMRETLRQCAGQGLDQGAMPLWQGFDQDNADKIGRALLDRRETLRRLFPKDPYVERRRNDAIIAAYSGRTLTAQQCAAAAETMRKVRGGGWGQFIRVADLELQAFRLNTGRCE
jgi:hypothetical protein